MVYVCFMLHDLYNKYDQLLFDIPIQLLFALDTWLKHLNRSPLA